ncbi:unnamed protein product [Adineta ricciae]|uniref:Apple domain-containing protein n=1 Tax=Adineta ricciae TaxID=249248 RepID=A0A813SEV9_ADIRI|nr:unnamed protein product [Adineta ricciae]CAF0793596.1 unnamed protein product [Adineta ricciae]
MFVFLLWMSMKSASALSVARIVNATYSAGIAFLNTNSTAPTSCMCSCIAHPHCLSISVTTKSVTLYQCQLFATYPMKSSQLSPSSTTYVMVYTNRTMKSVYLNNGTQLSNPARLFSNTVFPWIPIFKLFSGNNQSFLGLNSSNLTTLTAIPTIPFYQIMPHWFNILLAQWNQNLYVPSQLAIAFITNRTTIIDFLIFNTVQSNTTNWFSSSRFISNQYWSLPQYINTTIAQSQMIPVYMDSDCIRSLNCNFKYSSSGCTQDFYGYFFIHGGYKDSCIAAVRNVSQVPIPSIFYSITKDYTNGNINNYNISNGLIGFVH